MHGASAKPSRTAPELLTELDWAAQILTGDRSASRIRFALPAESGGHPEAACNRDVQVSCRPEQDAAAQAAVQHVADRWRLTVSAADAFDASAAPSRRR